jgi:3'(2'), 5'-bisphosphate nucleotidase
VLNEIVQIAENAGLEILKFYGSSAGVTLKADESPLTHADQASHELIVSRLASLTPDIPVISEESKLISPEQLKSYSRFWLVDPLDGTKEFLKKTGDFTVNIALIENRRPILGVIYVPVQQLFYFAENGKGAFKQNGHRSPSPIKIRRANADSLCVVASKDHAGPQVELMLKKIPGAELTSMGSSLKFCLVAEGKADIYPRFVPTMEWDTAAADCILTVAGGSVFALDGKLLEYQKPGLKNDSIIAVGDLSLDWKRLLP